VSNLEIKLRVHFELRSVEPLTCKQIAARLNSPRASVENKLRELLVEGVIKHRRSEQCNRPMVYIKADREWPEDTAAQAVRHEMQRVAARAMQH
jgi:predicted transcriptional regulator